MKCVNKLPPICLIVLGLVCTGCVSSSTRQLEDNKALVMRTFDETVKRNWAILDELYTTDYIWHQPGRPEPLTNKESNQFMRTFLAAFPDYNNTIEDMIAEDDKVVTRFTFSGTHKGEYMGIPATGKEIVLTSIMISRIVEGKIAEEWQEFDGYSFMRQLGAIPSDQ